MSIFTSLYTGTSGLEAHGDAINVVGDDIANVSTIGFKESRAEFSDVIGGQVANGQSAGAGVRMSGTQTLFGQGALQSTGRNLDLAIQGNGFFKVSGSHNGQQGDFFTRDGRMSVDKTGFLINPEGLRLQGYTIAPNGTMSTAVGDLKIGGASPPNATTTDNVAVNLDSTAPQPATFDPTNPSGTSNYSTATTVYDSLGNAHAVNIYFRNAGSGNWEYHAMVDGSDVGGTPGTPTEIAGGTLTFDTDGKLQAVAAGGSSANFVGATPGQAITFNFGDPTSTGGTGLAGSTGFASPSTIKSNSQDGYAAGDLTDVAVSDDGTITGKFTNGQSRAIARVALASFASSDGLQRAGDQLYTETPASGAPLVDAADTGKGGSIASGSLESSNVDLSTELVTLIAYQRAYSSNSKTVQTADEMLQETVNLKR